MRTTYSSGILLFSDKVTVKNTTYRVHHTNYNDIEQYRRQTS